MRLLYTNNTLSQPAGTELAVRDLCLEMKRRGHEVAAYSTQHGRVAAELAAAGVPVVGRVDEVPFVPEVIHGHHEWETTMAALRWPDCPVISFCRGVDGWQEAPCRAPNVVRWVAVDEPCQARLVDREGVPAEKVRLILNGIDLERFRQVKDVPATPRRALVFSNYANAQNFGAVVLAACAEAGLEGEIVGAGVGRAVVEPETLLAEQDVVFAKGKAALEALACGCAVMVCDQRGLGPLVTPGNFETLRRESFGFPCMTDPVTIEGIRARLADWNPAAVAEVTRLARAVSGSGRMFDELEALYAEVKSVPRREGAPTAAEYAAFGVAFLEAKGIHYKLGKEVWGQGAAAGLIPAEAANAGEAEVGLNRMLDRLRKGLLALVEVKRLRKEAGKPAPEAKKWRFFKR